MFGTDDETGDFGDFDTLLVRLQKNMYSEHKINRKPPIFPKLKLEICRKIEIFLDFKSKIKFFPIGKF